jgi:hypothetical protein
VSPTTADGPGAGPEEPTRTQADAPEFAADAPAAPPAWWPQGEDEPRRRPDPPQPARRRRRRWPWVVAALFVLIVAGLAILAIPLLKVRSDANAARAALVAGVEALRKGNLDTAQDRVASARTRIDRASGAVNGIGGDVWSKIPVAGGAIDDVRHLVSALDDATAIGEIGVRLYPTVLGDQASLVTDDTVDMTALANVTSAAEEVGAHLAAAHASLEEVAANAPLVGSAIGDARDAAMLEVTKWQGSLDRYQPLLEVLPTALGVDGDVSYLIAIMNPAEMRSSGGATLSLGQMTFANGKATFGNAGSTTDFTDNNEPISWPPVPDNPWHRAPPSKLVNASFSPNWTTSGEELLRAWQATSGEECDALIAIDLQAIGRLFEITGPLDVPGYGRLTAGNFVKTLAGSYDRFDNPEKRKRINEALIPVLRAKLLDGGYFVQKAQALLGAAAGRHFTTYFRDEAIENTVKSLGIAGDLSTTEHDYIGVFSQNTNASKVDYWERRTVASDITVHDDGSADVTLTVTVNNDTPPYTRTAPDPHRGYFTRWSLPNATIYLPIGAQISAVSVDGSPVSPALQSERGRSFFQQSMTIAPNSTAILQVSYHVPAAAVINSDGSLTYELAVDPHPLVNPEALDLRLHLPDGYAATSLPEGWTAEDDGVLTFQTAVLDTSPRWSIRATRG